MTLKLAGLYSRAHRASGASAGCGCCDTPEGIWEVRPQVMHASPVASSIGVGDTPPGSGGTETRELDVSLPDFQFAAAHFVASKGFRESLHGHNYSVQVRLGADRVQPDGYLIDFGDVKKAVRTICKTLKGRTLVPARSDVLKMRRVQEASEQLEIFCEDGSKFSIPAADCAMLPIAHSTAEEIAEYFWHELVGGSQKLGPMLRSRSVQWLEVGVYERPEQGARFRRTVPMLPESARPAAASSPGGEAGPEPGGFEPVAARPPAAGAVSAAPLVPAAATAVVRQGAEPGPPAIDPPGGAIFHVAAASQELAAPRRDPLAAAEAAFRELLMATLGPEEASGPVLAKTPARAAKAFFELNSGLKFENPLDAAGEGIFDFAEGHDVVSVRDVHFDSLCEHHLLPFSGRAHIAYIPDGKVLGLSKFARLIGAFGRRPQVQERLTNQMAQGLTELLGPRAVAVVLEAHHCCMSIRGVQQPMAWTRTLAICGPDSKDPATRQLLLGYIAGERSRL